MQQLKAVAKRWQQSLLTTIVGFFLLNVFFVWLKMYVAYQAEFSLGAKGTLQQFLLILNPLPTAIMLIGLGLYFRGKISYWVMLLMNLLQSVWLFSNILYYREFSDFLSLNIMNSGESAGNNLSKALGGLIKWTDFLVFADIIILIILLLVHVIKVDYKGIKTRLAFLLTLFGVVLMFVDYGISEKDRSGLLTRTFDNNYIVKYLGLNEYAAYNIYKTHQTEKVKDLATAEDLKPIEKFIKEKENIPNPAYFGAAKGKNVIMFHLESFQQFLIDYKVNGEEITPNLNKYYHDQNTVAFENFYNQVGQGKTADAEMMLETGLFGTASGSAMVNYGTSNTYQAVPAILSQRGYTTAALHGDVGTFWNRDNTYKSWGYDYFFSQPYYPAAKVESNNIGYGLKDKIFLKQASPYLDQLPQPFYSKVMTVTNHYPYELDSQNISVPKTKTGDKTVDGYVQTARYLDQAFGEFLTYLKETGLEKDTMVVLYGDHYGISENHPDAIAKLIGKDKVTPYDLANWQKVPFIIHADGLQGGVMPTYGGEIDVMPTIMHLLGISTKQNIQFGQDLLSLNPKQIVPFRNGNWASDEFTRYGGNYYHTPTGEKFTPNADEQKKIDANQKYVNNALTYSDNVQTGDLLRFYNLDGFKKVKRSDYSYKASDTFASLKQRDKKEKSSLKATGKTIDYKTDAPELGGKPQHIPERLLKDK